MKLKLVLATVMLVTAALMLTSLKRDELFDAYIIESSAVTDEMAAEISRDLSSSGVARAQQILDAKKPGLKKRLADLKTVPASQVDARTWERFAEGVEANRAKIMRLFADNRAIKKVADEDPTFRTNMRKLVEDYLSLIE
jgi:hypothetical protein